MVLRSPEAEIRRPYRGGYGFGRVDAGRFRRPHASRRRGQGAATSCRRRQHAAISSWPPPIASARPSSRSARRIGRDFSRSGNIYANHFPRLPVAKRRCSKFRCKRKQECISLRGPKMGESPTPPHEAIPRRSSEMNARSVRESQSARQRHEHTGVYRSRNISYVCILESVAHSNPWPSPRGGRQRSRRLRARVTAQPGYAGIP